MNKPNFPKITLPRFIHIGAHQVAILYPYKFSERSDLCAQWDYNAKEIRLADRDAGGNLVHPSSIAVTLIHEIIHAIDAITGHRIFQDHEKAIDGFAEAWLMIIRNNPELIHYLDEISQLCGRENEGEGSSTGSNSDFQKMF